MMIFVEGAINFHSIKIIIFPSITGRLQLDKEINLFNTLFTYK